MSNTHEYIVFDRAKLDRVLAMRWPAFDKAYPGWSQWESARSFLAEWALDEELVESVDDILARKTVRETLAMNTDQFHILWGILDEKDLWEGGVDLEKGDYDYADDIVSCAGAAYLRGDLSLASLTAVCHLHASWIDMTKVLRPAVAKAVLAQPKPAPMLPGLPNLMNDYGDGIGVVQSRKAIDFFLKAWQQDWPVHAEKKTRRKGKTIRSCVAAGDMYDALQNRRLSKPCMFHWYE